MYSAKVIADSISPFDIRLTTLEVVFPRFILAEFNTHRVLSRNSASSRAIPTEKIIEQVENDPFIPVFNQRVKGMGVGEPLDEEKQHEARKLWVQHCGHAIGTAKAMKHIDKSRVNRLLEPFMWHTVIVSGTEWSNFFALRISPEAQPEMCKAAILIKEALSLSQPVKREYGDEHLPYVSNEEREDLGRQARKVSVGRCARVSYLSHDGKREVQADIDMHDRLVTNGHMSPTEHQATPKFFRHKDDGWSGNFYGWVQYRQQIPHQHDYSLVLAS